VPQIVDKPALTVVGLETAFIHALSADTNNVKVIGPLWDTFLHRAKDVPNRTGNAIWLPQSAWQHAEIADVELYDERFDCSSDQSEMEYWISVTPKRAG
jgi:predicted transcriptional regulator YdeE